MQLRPIIRIILLAACLAPQGAFAAATDPLIEGAKLCTRHLPRYEREYGIPTHLLSAIASTESGRYHSGLKIKVPWPWTINAEGKGYFFDSKAEAIQAARNLRARGVQSMDVGCMQVNLYHHAQAFSSLEQAFEPEYNIAYAASFLRGLYQEDGGNWKQAAADYHSKTPQLGKEYVGLVYNSWYNIIDKLRAARLSVPSSSVNGLRDMAKTDAPAAAPNKFVQPKIMRLPEQEGRKLAAYKSPHMNTITVSNNTAKENGVMIVRPEIKSTAPSSTPSTPTNANFVDVMNPRPMETMTIAAKQPTPQPAPAPEAKVIRLDNTLLDRRPVNSEAKKSGPNFIFSD